MPATDLPVTDLPVTDLPVNILVMVHGISPEPLPFSPEPMYGAFWRSLQCHQPILGDRFPQGYIGVSWGQELPKPGRPPLIDLRPDQCLTRAQNFINQRTSYEQIKAAPDPNSKLLEWGGDRSIDFPWYSPIVRGLVANLREQTLIQGVGDAIYYCSRDGEFYIRRAVYGQVLSQLDDYLEAKEVRLHLIGHSLGVTLTHDFLYGLFAPNHRPDYYRQAEEANALRFERWRAKAERGELKLGSLTSMASQLPLFALRRQVLVDQLAAGQLLDGQMIGLRPDVEPRPGQPDRHPEAALSPDTALSSGGGSMQAIQWQLFYDVDDLLAFGTRRLYDQPSRIREVQVDTGDNPAKAHVNYWENRQVIAQTAALLLATTA
ncbi:MAG: hypothetical protein HC824_03975 [Synechococcales cyanobacterium RM1_1_8]|nr:hypothetical protein [Synechococcales cyanobacterium RM1_1_8]